MVDFDYLRYISHTTSILEVLDHYGIEYQPAGTNRYKAVCPFHDDHDPSLVLYVNPDDEDHSFYCFVDNLGGDVFRLIQLLEQDFKEAWSVLCYIRGIEDADATSIDSLELARQSLQKEKKSEEVSVLSYVSQIAIMYRDFLDRNKNSTNYEQLKEQVDNRFKALDDYLDSNPPSVAMRQFYLHELQYLTTLQSRTNQP